MSNEMIIFILMFILIFSIACAFFHEKYMWNNGICRKSGQRWIYFDSCYCGDRGYKDNENNYCWVSYPFIDGK